jgi:hypothetical protein
MNLLHQLQSQVTSDGGSGALQSVQRDTGIARVEETVKCAAAGLHARSHGGLSDVFHLHSSLDLIRQDLFVGLFFAILKQASFGQERIEG